MNYNCIWEDCINKMEDLDLDIDKLSDALLPKEDMHEDPVHGPLILSMMYSIQKVENLLSGVSLMYIEYNANDYMSFAFQRGYLTTGSDERLNTLLAINFIIDELQMDRVLLYKRSNAKQSILSPNRNVPALQQRTTDLSSLVSTPSTTVESSIQKVYEYCDRFNSPLLSKEEYSQDDIDKLLKYNQFCTSLYNNKKIMMLQRLDVTIQSLLWNQPQQYDTSRVEGLRNEIDITRSFTVDDIFASRRSLLQRVFKVSTVAYKNKGSFRSQRIGAVPDRGGRIVESANNTKKKVVRVDFKSSNKRNLEAEHQISEKSGKVDAAGTQTQGSSFSHRPYGVFNETEKVVRVFGSAMTEENKVISSNSQRKVCFDFRKGQCKYGNRCKYSHS